MMELFELFARGGLVKEAIPLVLKRLAENPELEPEEAVKQLGLTPLSLEEAREAVRRILNRMESLIKERGEAAFGPAMGAVMRELRGRVDGALLSRIVREELAKMVGGS